MKAFVTRRKRPLAVLSVLTVAIATAVAISVGGAQARSERDRAEGRRVDVRRSVGGCLAAEVRGHEGRQDHLQPDRQRRRHLRDLEQDRRLRGERRTDDAGSVQFMRRLRRVSLGARAPTRSCTTCRDSRTTCTSRGPIIAGIYLGQIKKWNDPKIKAVNKGVNLPSTDITPVYRSDSSGTTFNFTTYLNTVSTSGSHRSDEDDRQLAGRCRCSRKLRRLGSRLPHRRSDRLCRHGLRSEEPSRSSSR